MIYILKDPRTDEVRYVGITRGSLERRLYLHVYRAEKGEDTHKARWIRQLIALGAQPLIEAIDDSCDMTREIFWIAYYLNLGCKLTNSTDGGDGLSNMSDGIKDKIRQSVTGSRHTEEAKRKISEALKEQWASGLKRKGMLGKRHSPETIEKIRQGNKGKPGGMLGKRQTPETIEKIRASNRESWKKRHEQ